MTWTLVGQISVLALVGTFVIVGLAISATVIVEMIRKGNEP
ncbi:MAG: hypothetical protein ACRCZP_11490 [Phycicoccus sp.]